METHNEIKNSCKRSRAGVGVGGDQDDTERDAGHRLRAWPLNSSSRIFRVSRASGGKDRHSKVLTAKGLRDRRVRLSVSTAIQFYDLQDRLGYDQPSKAVEWLIQAASAAISELPSLDTPFGDLLNLQQADGGKQIKPPEDQEVDETQHRRHQNLSLSKSGCSSTSDNSKGSVLSLSRSDTRTLARERARERTTAKVDKDQDDPHHAALNACLNSQSSFTELLTGDGVHKEMVQLPALATANYFNPSAFLHQAQKNHDQPTGFSSETHYGNTSPMATMMPFNFATPLSCDHPELQQLFLPDYLIPVSPMVPSAAALGDYGLNFSISPCLAGFSRGTLQSNYPSQLPHQLQRLSSQAEVLNTPFFFGTTITTAAAASPEYSQGIDGRLQLCYGDGFRHSDLKDKGNKG